MNLLKVINFKTIGDERGSLISLESNKNIPFELKRVYYIFGTKLGVGRGFHAHKSLKQILVCLRGSCRVTLDNIVSQEEIILDTPDKGLYVGKMIWREIHDFSYDCVLMVLADEYYDENDYIRDYKEFNKLLT